MGYDAGKLSLIAQGITGSRLWLYEDTGGEAVSVYEGAGYFADAGSRGADTGDYLFLKDKAAKKTYQGRFTAVQDTGNTQGTVTLDTGPDIPG